MVHLQGVSPGSKVCKFATKFSQIDDIFLSAELEEFTTKLLLSFCLNRENIRQRYLEKLQNDSCDTSLSITAVVHTTIEDCFCRSSVDPIFPIATQKHRCTPTSTLSKADTRLLVCSVENIRQSNYAENVPNQIVHPLASNINLDI